MKKIGVILVHGTFAQMTGWDDCREERDAPHNIHNGDSAFVAGLRNGLEAEGVDLRVSSLNWSGENSHQARRRAALRLRSLIEDLADTPATQDGLFVIGHSHGGTIARLATNSLRDVGPPVGIITFGAPFVRFHPRPIRRLMTAAVWSLYAAMALITLSIIMVVETFEGTQILVFGLPLLLIAAIWAGRWIRLKQAKLLRLQEKLIDRYDPVRIPPIQHLNYHAKFDEAGLLLRIWGFMSWVSTTVVSTLFYSSLFYLAAVLATGVGAILYFLELIEGPYVWFGFTVLAGGAMLVTLALVSAVLLPICIYVPWWLRRTGIAFGGEASAWNMACRIVVDRVGSSQAEFRGVFFPEVLRRFEMQHNHYYENETVIAEVSSRLADWSVTPDSPSGHIPWMRRVRDLGGSVALLCLTYFVLESVGIVGF